MRHTNKPPRKAMLTNATVRRLTMLMTVGCLVLATTAVPARADFVPITRVSEVSVSTVNLGGGGGFDSTSDLFAPFNSSVIGSGSHTEPAGHENFGAWLSVQDTTINTNELTSLLATEALAERVSGTGSPIVNSASLFEIEFEVSDIMDFELGGSFQGTANDLTANDFVRVQLQEHNGISYNDMFSTQTGGDLQSSFFGTFTPNTLYRLAVLSTAKARGDDSNESSVDVFLRNTVVPEPSTVALALVVPFLLIYRSRALTRRANKTSIA